jgi:Spy/CpxP family protein refolding chaperone
MKPPVARTATMLAFLLLALAPVLLSAQGPGGPPHSGPPGAAPGMPGPNAPGAPRTRDLGPTRSRGSMGAMHSPTQFGPAGRWWDDKNVTQTIGITRDQQRRMDSIFDANKPSILESYKTFLKQQSRLEAINKDPHADQATTFAAIDAVNNARAALQKATAQMLLQIRHEMSADQIEKLEKLP